MNIQHLRAMREVVRQGFQVSQAAIVLGRAQPGISRQIIELEEELGVQLFRRSKNRIQGLTAVGRDLLPVFERVLDDLAAALEIASEHRADDAGQLLVATTHTHAHYSLPDVIGEFTRRYPKVRVALRQGNPQQCLAAVAAGTADIAISTIAATANSVANSVANPVANKLALDEVVSVPAYRIIWDMVAVAGHPILKQRPLTMEKIAQYPLITHDSAFSGRQVITEAFASVRGTPPHIVLDGADADVSKAYVERGLGIAILARVAYNKKRDRNLRLLGMAKLLPPSTLCVSLRRGRYLRRYMVDFISLYAPHLTKAAITAILRGREPGVSADSIPTLG